MEESRWSRSPTISFLLIGKGCRNNFPGRTLPQGQSVMLTNRRFIENGLTQSASNDREGFVEFWGGISPATNSHHMGVNMSEPAVVPCAAFTAARPDPSEYNSYYERYISLVPDGDILSTLDLQRRQMLLLLSGRDEAEGSWRYAPGKWTVSEVLGHVCDTERIFAYRALRISRGDQTPIEGFEQDDYVKNG